jgi:hypothetical protein
MAYAAYAATDHAMTPVKCSASTTALTVAAVTAAVTLTAIRLRCSDVSLTLCNAGCVACTQGAVFVSS